MSTPVRELRELVETVSGEQDRAIAACESDGQLARARARFLEAAGAPARPSSGRARPAVGAATVLAAAAAVALFVRSRQATFGVGGDRGGVVGSEIAAPTTEALSLRFSDGSRVDLDPGAKGRVASLDAGRTRVVLESGRASFALAEGKGGAWSIDAGAFHVTATPGTHFVVAFAVSSEAIDVTLERGSAEVSAPCGRQNLAPGGALHMTCATPAAALSGSAPSASSAAGSVGEAPQPAPSSSASSALAAPPAADWRKLAADARYREAVDAAVAAGFDHECASASAADLLALGDAARLTGDPSHAAAAYVALRRRFPSDGRAAVAAFDLGKVAFDARGAYAEAARWFDTYLAEQPGGALAREALGRSMEAHWRSGDLARARDLAGQYMQRFPGGPHEDLARRIVAE